MKLGRYQVLDKLATGGMAEVYLARATGPMGFEKELVVKRILPHLASDERFVEMFLAEARLAARLNHPNIVQVFDFGEADGTWYLAMEYVDGLNLKVLLKRAREAGVELPPASCARIIASVCEGLAYAHERTDPATGEPLEIIHRDISPDNILLSRDGAVKVVDFGIAKEAGQELRTQTGVVKGKLAYMPPERFRGVETDRRMDVYGLGVVLYELLTGHKPYETDSGGELVRAILYEQPVPVTKWRPELQPALRRILERAMAKEREHRYADCRALQADLERFILGTGEPVGAWQLSRLLARVMEKRGEEKTVVESGMTGSQQQQRTPTPRPMQRVPALPCETVAPVALRMKKEGTTRPEAADAVTLRERAPQRSEAPTIRLEKPPQLQEPRPAAGAPVEAPSESAQRRSQLRKTGAGIMLLLALGACAFLWSEEPAQAEPLTAQVTSEG
ncbi:serine/threonine protein kinase [Archangium lipolyticum]|uniref:serine/threonine protein kinase n=1 Tax=Archangium lipolyticum TaxID=2970465 RepID=UPI0038996BF0